MGEFYMGTIIFFSSSDQKKKSMHKKLVAMDRVIPVQANQITTFLEVLISGRWKIPIKGM